MVFLTSNDSRDLSEALKRRCLYLHVGYPTPERERDILLARVQGLDADLAAQVARIVRRIRELDLKKPPSISESIDWARTLVLLGAGGISEAEAPDTLHVLLKYEADIAKARADLLGQAAPAGRSHVDSFRTPEGRSA
jgi:MoxR-like ATPase